MGGQSAWNSASSPPLSTSSPRASYHVRHQVRLCALASCLCNRKQAAPDENGKLNYKGALEGGGRWGDAHARSPLLHKSNGVALRILPRFHSQGLGSAPPFQPHFKLLSLCALLSFLLAPQDLGTPPPPLTSPLYRQELGLRVLQALVDSHFLFVRAHGAQHR